MDDVDALIDLMEDLPEDQINDILMTPGSKEKKDDS
jgi:hypothetical protein